MTPHLNTKRRPVAKLMAQQQRRLDNSPEKGLDMIRAKTSTVQSENSSIYGFKRQTVFYHRRGQIPSLCLTDILNCVF